MNAKHIVALIASALAASACVPGNGPIRVTGTFPYDDKCEAGDVAVARGRLDLGGAGSYFVVAKIDNEALEVTTKDFRGNVISQPGANNFIAESVQLSYSASPAISGFVTESVAYSGVIKPASEGNAWGLNLIGPKALEKLQGGWTQDTMLSVTFSFRGHLESGNAAQSNPYTFPILVTNQNPAMTPCVAPSFLAPTGPCGTGGGQDGTTIKCCASAADPGCTP